MTKAELLEKVYKQNPHINKWWYKTILFVRTCIYVVAYVFCIIASSLAIFLCSLLLGRSIGFKVSGYVTQSAAIAYRWICGGKYLIEGRRFHRPNVYYCSHQAAWDVYYCHHLFSPATSIAKKELMYTPFLNLALVYAGILVDRKKPVKSVKHLIKKGRVVLKVKRNVVLYGTGTRVLPGNAPDYFIGGPMLAAKAGVPLLPVAIYSGNCWPKGLFLKYPGTIRVKIGPPVFGTDPKVMMKQASDWINNELDKMYEENPPAWIAHRPDLIPEKYS